GPQLVMAAAERAEGQDARALREAARSLTTKRGERTALSSGLTQLMARHPDRCFATRYDRELEVIVDRPLARFSAWYEMFPRSASPTPGRHGTLKDAEARLDYVAGMGFDVLYLPPIHPIGRSFRKGANNAIKSTPEDPGSPWAIGGAEGGHKELHPELGTLDDFRALVRAAKRRGLEIALDLAFQVSPDHPYVTEHPAWFRARPDGTIKYAENPPKKYQDIYPFDFESEDWRALWQALLDVTLFWVRHEVRVFRVDNPHTKTFGFWEWLIDRVHASYPDVIFLAEAVTRPALMQYLAKAGFTQSYSYFTWRNTKPELVEYFSELTQSQTREFMRPNLFANTPDILHAYLQHGGPPAFRARLLLAATLGASYGVYSGFELAEGRAVPGTEEYADSEKYQFRKWDWDRPGHLTALVAPLNRIRHEHPSLQSGRSLRFHQTDNPEIIAYSKTTPDGSDTIFMAVNLDPRHMQHGHVEVPLDLLGLPAPSPDTTAPVRDLTDEAA